jgi:hypothetical protein
MNTTELLGQQVEVYHLHRRLICRIRYSNICFTFAGGGEPSSASSFEYDGTSWTAGGNLNTAREALAGSGSGTQTSSLAFGGSGGPVTASTEAYDGTSWTTNGSLATARNALAGSGTQTSGFSFWRISSINRNRRIYRWTNSCN